MSDFREKKRRKQKHIYSLLLDFSQENIKIERGTMIFFACHPIAAGPVLFPFLSRPRTSLLQTCQGKGQTLLAISLRDIQPETNLPKNEEGREGWREQVLSSDLSSSFPWLEEEQEEEGGWSSARERETRYAFPMRPRKGEEGGEKDLESR